MAWKVASDGEVLDVHVQAEKDCTRQDQTSHSLLAGMQLDQTAAWWLQMVAWQP